MKMMSDVEKIVNNDEFFAETVYTPKEGVEQQRKRKCLKGAINKGKTYLASSQKQWTHERVDKASN